MRESRRVSVAGALDVTQTSLYDKVNRLETAEEQAGPTSHWKQVYAYDQFGNRTLGAGTTYPSQLDAASNPQVSPANNRITSAGYSYDEAGNLLCDPVRPCAQSPSAAYYSYDAENKMKAAAGGFGGGGTTYSYDGDGRRVKKATYEGEVTVFVYDAAGRAVAEYSNQVQYNGTSYLTQDTLGSTRVVTGQDRSVRSRRDYFPFGEEIGAGVGGRIANQGYSQFDGVRQRFTGQERDDETGLDYFNARYYASTQGRFTSVDPYDINMERQYAEDDEKANHLLKQYISNPQRWNRYGFCLNNPLKYVDPSGEKEEEITLRLNIVYDKETIRSKEEAERLAGKTIADAQKTYGTIGIKLEVTFTPGTATGGVYDSGRQISAESRREDAINVFISRDRGQRTVGNTSDGGSGDIFINYGSDRYGAPRNPSEHVLAHELGHKFGVNQKNGFSNLAADIIIDRDNAFLRAGKRIQTVMVPAPGRNSTHVMRPVTRELPVIQIYRQGASRLARGN